MTETYKHDPLGLGKNIANVADILDASTYETRDADSDNNSSAEGNNPQMVTKNSAASQGKTR